MRTAKELLIASNAFASEDRWTSWWHLCSTLCIYGLLVTVTSFDLPWPLKLLANQPPSSTSRIPIASCSAVLTSPVSGSR